MNNRSKQCVRIVPDIVLGEINTIRPSAVEFGVLLVEGLPLDGEGFALGDAGLGRGKIHDVQIDARHLDGALERLLEMIACLVGGCVSVYGNRIFTRHVDCVFRRDQSHAVSEHRDFHVDILPFGRCHLQGFAQRGCVNLRRECDSEIRQFACQVHGLFNVQDLGGGTVHGEGDSAPELRVQRTAIQRLNGVREDEAIGMPVHKQLIVKKKLVVLYGGKTPRQGNLLVCGLVPQLDGLF